MTDPLDAVIALGVGTVTAPFVLWELRRMQILDHPTPRSSHDRPTPRAGGIAPAVGALTAALFSTVLPTQARAAVLFLAVSMGILGLIDDIHGLAPKYRLMGQLALSTAALVWLGRDLSGSPIWQLVFLTGVVVWLIAFVNAFNFMDGINGISVAQVLVAGCSWWIVGAVRHVPAVSALGLIGAAALLAFAPFNVPRASMFLGDVGSYFFGGWLAATAVVGLRAGIPPEAMLAPLTLYGADTITTLARRAIRGAQCFTPHREHVYQRLVEAGWTHAKTALFVGFTIAILSALGLLGLSSPLLRVLSDILIALCLLGYLALPDALPHRAPCGPAPR
jgi:UDP-N-acetylmuramyl pentapeptide phosphotransferase/UDP-N-acetylglucosamine-1-phosphate transferase